MTAPPAGLPHLSIPYAEQGHGLSTGFTVALTDRLLEITDDCPSCQGRTVSGHEVGSPQGHKGVFPRRPRTEPAPKRPVGVVTVICACGFPHAERPAESGESGCGAYWKVELP